MVTEEEKTKADKAIEDANEYLTKAIISLSDVVINNVEGSNKYKTIYSIKLQQLLFDLLNLKRTIEG